MIPFLISLSSRITKKVISGVYQGVTTVELDNLAAETAPAYLTSSHSDYAILAARIAISNLHKETKKKFSEVVEDLYRYVNPKNGRPASLISDFTNEVVRKNAEVLDSAIVYNRDIDYNLCPRSYLLRLDERVAERLQHMLMRVAVGTHGNDIDRTIETYRPSYEPMFFHPSQSHTRKISCMHFYGWRRGLKTGMYYLHTRPTAQAIQFTVDQSYLKKKEAVPQEPKPQPPQSVPQPQVSATMPTPSPSPKPEVETSVAATTSEMKKLSITQESSSSVLTESASASASASTSASTSSTAVPASLDERTAKAAAEDPEFAAALQRQRDRELETGEVVLFYRKQGGLFDVFGLRG